jgi:diaminohydroxyphosphoribosylaminopyrimidine deaminase/5-amino-6-(5-phosphoribosylamino)uracil reductase
MSKTAPEDIRWMALALSLSSRTLGQTWPNPAVGCVIVKDGRVQGRGHTAPGGRPHAETQALLQAGSNAKDATAYVTLEPCSHTGQTGPCAIALVAAGISRVVIATKDPDPRVSGQGINMLAQAGLAVTTGVLAKQAAKLHEGFFSRILRGRPVVTLKLASSVDGRIATSKGESQWITGPAARRYVHLLRSQHDAIMVGSGTAIADDPMLNVRTLGTDHQPVRVICDTKLRTPLSSKLASSAQETPVWMLHTKSRRKLSRQWEDLGANCIQTPRGKNNRIDLEAAMTELGARGITRVFCEGGGTLAAALLDDDLVDTLITIQAGLVLGAKGLGAIGALSGENLVDFQRLTAESSQLIGGDVVTEWRR